VAHADVAREGPALRSERRRSRRAHRLGELGGALHVLRHAQFRFADGAIAEHVDTFSLWRWTSQALGLPGLLLGWTPMVRGKVRRQAAATLAKFSAERRQRLDGA
jgi:hypothetical protein